MAGGENSRVADPSGAGMIQSGRDPLLTGYRRTVPANALSQIAAAILVTITLWGHVPPGLLLPWSAPLVLLALASLVLGWTGSRQRKLFDNDPAMEQIRHLRRQRQRRIAVVWSGVSGIFWGSGVAFLPHLEPQQQIVLIIITAGMVSGGATTLAALPAAAAAFILAATLPFAAYFLLADAGRNMALGLMSAVFAGAMVAASRVVSSMVAYGRRLNEENASLFLRIQAAQVTLLDIAETAEAFVLVNRAGAVRLWNRRFAQLLNLGPDRLYEGAALDDLLATVGLATARLGRPEPLFLASGRWVRSALRDTAHGDRILMLIDVTEQHRTNMQLGLQTGGRFPAAGAPGSERGEG